jgi:hypothetical protein
VKAKAQSSPGSDGADGAGPIGMTRVSLASTEVLGPEVDRLATLHTNARTDTELLKVWLKSHKEPMRPRPH